MSRLRSPGSGDLTGFRILVPSTKLQADGHLSAVEEPHHLLIECKDETRINLPGYCDQAEHDAKGGFWVAVVKRRMKATGKSYVVTDLDTFIRMFGGVPEELPEVSDDGEADS